MDTLDSEKTKLDEEALRMARDEELRVKETRSLLRDAIMVRPKTEDEWKRLAIGKSRANIGGVRRLYDLTNKDEWDARMVLLALISEP